MINFPGPDKILLLMVIALVVLGPTRLPSAARTVGRWIGELRKLNARFQDEMGGALAEPRDALAAAVGDLHREVGTFRSDVAGFSHTVTNTLPPAQRSEPATWASASNGAITSPSEVISTSPSSPAASVSGVPGVPGLPALPPVPDDPSLN